VLLINLELIFHVSTVSFGHKLKLMTGYIYRRFPRDFIPECNNMQDTTNCTHNQNNFFEMLSFVITNDYGTCLKGEKLV
jgi:hypothetical protein